MEIIDIRNDSVHVPNKEDLRVYFGRNDEYLITEKSDEYLIIVDEDEDRTRVCNTDIDALIRALQILKERL